jgi:hypothetical protein
MYPTRSSDFMVGSHVRRRMNELGTIYLQLEQAQRQESGTTDSWLSKTREGCLATVERLPRVRVPSIVTLVILAARNEQVESGVAGERRRTPRAIRSARHEASHTAALLFFGVVPDEITIAPAPPDGGYVTGRCEWTGGKRSVDILATAVGVRDGHGVGNGDGVGDLYELEQLVPDAGEREHVLHVAERVMRHRQFLKVRDAIRRRLQFRDVLYRDEIERIAASVLPNAVPPFHVGPPGSEATTSARRPVVALSSAAKVVDAVGVPRSVVPAEVPQHSEVRV